MAICFQSKLQYNTYRVKKSGRNLPFIFQKVITTERNCQFLIWTTGEIKVDKNATFTDVVKPKVVFKINYRVESTTIDVVRNTAQNRVAEVDSLSARAKIGIQIFAQLLPPWLKNYKK